jgi:hypothetical protein
MFGFRTSNCWILNSKSGDWSERECHSLPDRNGRSFSFSQLPFGPLQRLKCHLFSGAFAAHCNGQSFSSCRLFSALATVKVSAFCSLLSAHRNSCHFQLLETSFQVVEVLPEEPTLTNHLSAGGHFGRHRKRLRRPPSENRGRSSDWSWGDHSGQYQSGQGGHGRCRLARVERCAFEKVSLSDHSRSTTLRDGAF